MSNKTQFKRTERHVKKPEQKRTCGPVGSTQSHTCTTLLHGKKQEPVTAPFSRVDARVFLIYLQHKLTVWQEAFAFIRISCCPKCICVVGVKGN